MRRRFTAALVFATMSLLMISPPVFAQDGHLACGSGKEFAQEHIRVQAQNQTLGQAHGHNPGKEHSGFKVCEPPAK
jgi:hypothetical protein